MIDLITSLARCFRFPIGTLFLFVSGLQLLFACSQLEKLKSSPMPIQVKQGTHIVVRSVSSDAASLALINDSESSIFVGYEQTDAGFVAISYALYCNVNNEEEDFTPEAHASLERVQLPVGGEIPFQVSRLPKRATSCRVFVRYFDNADAVLLLDSAIAENRFEKLTIDELKFIESAKKDADVTFQINGRKGKLGPGLRF